MKPDTVDIVLCVGSLGHWVCALGKLQGSGEGEGAAALRAIRGTVGTSLTESFRWNAAINPALQVHRGRTCSNRIFRTM